MEDGKGNGSRLRKKEERGDGKGYESRLRKKEENGDGSR